MSAIEDRKVFSGYRFNLVGKPQQRNNELVHQKQLAQLIKQHGGEVKATLSRRCHFLVYGNGDAVSKRIAKAKEFGVKCYPTSFVYDSIRDGKLANAEVMSDAEDLSAVALPCDEDSSRTSELPLRQDLTIVILGKFRDLDMQQDELIEELMRAGAKMARVSKYMSTKTDVLVVGSDDVENRKAFKKATSLGKPIVTEAWAREFLATKGRPEAPSVFDFPFRRIDTDSCRETHDSPKLEAEQQLHERAAEIKTLKVAITGEPPMSLDALRNGLRHIGVTLIDALDDECDALLCGKNMGFNSIFDSIIAGQIAEDRKIPLVDASWSSDSIDAGHALPFVNYIDASTCNDSHLSTGLETGCDVNLSGETLGASAATTAAN
ncbi:MAG: hypothetical protein MHM6MM_003159 [Cercozoa sp. M6MM]